jgi:hypothetical protein
LPHNKNRSGFLVILLFFFPGIGWAQMQSPRKTDAPKEAEQAEIVPSESASAVQGSDATLAPTHESEIDLRQDDQKDDQKAANKKKKESDEEKQTKRMFWVVPNFAAVSANTQLPPLSTRQKFSLASHDAILDYSSFTWAGVLAGQALLLNSDPELGHGAAGYGRYYWRTFADGVSGAYFTEAIVPALTHEDPRYYTLGHGGFWRRTRYSLSRTFVTKTDSGGMEFNWSEVGGNACVAALSNAYYPPQERGVGQTLRDWGTQMESAALNNIVKEFWPDIRRKILRQK